MSEPVPTKIKDPQSSFTLIETIIALALMATMVLEVSAVQGRAISYSSFERKVTQAIWLAKSVMGQVEYKWKYYDLKDANLNEKEAKFPSEICSELPAFDCNFRYTISIEKWDLPLIDLAAASLGDPSIAGILKEQLKNVLGEDILKVAHVEVTWPEGSRKNSVDIAYLLTAQQKLDEAIESLQPPGGVKGGTSSGAGGAGAGGAGAGGAGAGGAGAGGAGAGGAGPGGAGAGGAGAGGEGVGGAGPGPNDE